MDNFTKNQSIDNVMAFFTGNPLSTIVGQKIESATDVGMSSENWQLNMEICDDINSSEETSKEALKAIKKRLSNKNFTVIMYTLTVLETAVKNSNHFHTHVTNKDFINNELLKIIGPKNDPPTIVSEKVLGLIQSWADTFKNTDVVEIYQDLKYKGIEFPMTNIDNMAPIITPNRKDPILHPVNLGRQQTTPSIDQLEKLRSEMLIVQGNMTVFSEILSEIDNQDERGLLEELFETSKEMQKRIMDLLSTINSDEIVGELLHLNDEINNCFLRYGRYKKNVEKKTDLIDFEKPQDEKKETMTSSEFDTFLQERAKK